jgi:hypothetical protein
MFGEYLRSGCPGTDRSRRSRRTTRRTLRIGLGCVNSVPYRPLQAYSPVHDFAYVYPAVVGRLTAAGLTYALNGRRFGGRSRISSTKGRPAGSGGPDQKVER